MNGSHTFGFPDTCIGNINTVLISVNKDISNIIQAVGSSCVPISDTVTSVILTSIIIK